MELINDGRYSEYLPRYFDLISRGYPITPVGVSDSHSSTGGVGETRTFVAGGSDVERDVIAAMKTQQTVASRGPYIHATIDNQFAPGRTYSGVQELFVEIFHPTWMVIDTVSLYENGVEVEVKAYTGSTLSFDLSPDADAHFSVIANGGQSMAPLYGRAPWACTAALKIDIAGDGWEPPLPPLSE